MALLLIGFALIALMDMAPLVRRRSRRGLAAFFLLFLPALALAVLETMKIEVPSAMLLLGDALKAIGLSYR